MKNILFASSLLASTFLYGQEIEYPPLSPKGSIEQVVGNTTFRIEYERPSVRSRVIFGELVPWGKIWRTGAGHCTTISFDRPVKFFEQEIPAGKYSLFTKPNPNEWYFMLNKDTTLRGTRDYSSTNDIIQFISTPEKTKRLYETMTFDIEMVDNNARITLSWERTRVGFLIKTSTNDKINTEIKTQLLLDENKNLDNYTGGASFLLARGEDLVTALILAEKALELDPRSEVARNLKITICEGLGKYQEALEEIETTISILSSKGNRTSEINKLITDRQRIAKLKKKQK